jgi:hypothetical protein
LGSNLRDALQEEGSANVVACLHVPRALTSEVITSLLLFGLVAFTAFSSKKFFG